MAGEYKAVDISNQTVAVSSAPSKKDRHIATLEDKVDELTLEVTNLKKQLSIKPVHINYKEQYEKAIKELHKLWYDELPF